MLTGSGTPGWVPLARLLRPQGRRGELLADPLSDLPGLLATGREAFLASANAMAPDEGASPLVIEDHFYPTGKNAGRIVLKLSGCDTISQAELLSGSNLLMPATELPALDPDTFFVGDLVGCILFDSAGPGAPLPVGTVVDVEFPTTPDGRTRLEDAAPLLAVSLNLPETNPPADPVLVPFVNAWLDSVDIPSRRITMRLPEGLFDPPT